MTIAVLRSLHTIIGNAIDDIESVYVSHGHATTSESKSSQQTPEKAFSGSSYASESEEKISISIDRPPLSISTSQAYASPPPSPSMTTSSHPILPPVPTPNVTPSPALDFPSLDAPCDPTSLSEVLTMHPVVLAAIGRIVAAAGQMSATVNTPFLTLCDVSMGYHLPSCMRLLEASNVVEILREAGHGGLHVDEISLKNGVKATKLAHILRLLATHHMLREVSPDVFALNRISSLVDSGKTFSELKGYQEEGMPEMKYRNTNGIAAFVGLCTDEIQKASAYMTETYYLSPSEETREGREPGKAPFCFAFDTVKSRTGFFGWLEGEVESTAGKALHDEDVETGRGGMLPPTPGRSQERKSSLKQTSVPVTPRPINKAYQSKNPSSPTACTDPGFTSAVKYDDSNDLRRSNRFRLERFGKAMSGTDGWEAPGAALNGFDWHSLPRGSVVVDVGGGIGSTSMLLATAFSSPSMHSGEEELGLKFIIQDRPVVCDMGEKAWKAKCPHLLESTARFQVHDFFTPQPVRNAAVFLLRVVLHDWPNDFAVQILFRLREAAMPETKLIIADFVLPLACLEDTLEGIEGAENDPAPAPLLPNLGKASANVYWMDLTMQVMFNSQERTLRELVALTLSAGWQIVKVTRTPGSLFGYIIAVPVDIPPEEKGADLPSFLPDDPVSDSSKGKLSTEKPARDHLWSERERSTEKERKYREDMAMIERSNSRCGTPTFGSNTRLSSVEETLARFGGGIIRPKATGGKSISTPSGTPVSTSACRQPLLKPALSLSMRKKPSPLSVPPLQSSPSPIHSPSRKLWPNSASPRRVDHPHAQASIQLSPAPRIIARRLSLANLRSTPSSTAPFGPPPLPTSVITDQPPPSPLSPLHMETQAVQTPTRTRLLRRASTAQLSQVANAHATSASGYRPIPPVPSLIPLPVKGGPDTPSLNIILRPGSRGETLGSPRAGLSSSLRQPGPVVSRRASNAQISHSLPLRKRSGTVIGTSRSETLRSPVSVGLAGSTSDGCLNRLTGISGLSNTAPGAVLSFNMERSRMHARGLSMSASTSTSRSSLSSASTRSPSPVGGGVCVLAAAAQIERGELVHPSWSP